MNTSFSPGPDLPSAVARPSARPSARPAYALLHNRQLFPRDLPALRADLAWFEDVLPRAAPEYVEWIETEIHDHREAVEILEQVDA